MNDQSIQELQHALRASDGEMLDGGTLAAIRRSGARRRTTARVLTGVGTSVVVGAVALTLALTGTVGGGTDEPPVANDRQETPKELSPLAKRALAEVPGAVQVSEWQVVLPAPDARSDYWMGERQLQVVGEPVPMDARTYQGVTMFPSEAWPAWLYQGVFDDEQAQGNEEDGYPVGSTDNGILVEAGDAVLACVSWKQNPCGPALMTRTSDGKLHHNWGMGTDDFLAPGSDMEVFLSDDYSTGSAGTLAFAGLPGTDVARVEFVTTAGQVVEGRLDTTFVEGASMMSARVPGDLAKVVAYNASGDVIEDHPLKPCDNDVDCEVR
jgi:hypothetical protein